MRVRLEVVLSAGRRESVELDIESSSKVRDLKEVLCKKFGLIADDHVLERILDVPMPGVKELEFDSTGKLAYTGRDAIVRTPTALDEGKTLAEHQVSSTDELLLAWKPGAHTRCQVCGLQTTICAEGYGIHCHSELRICSQCHRADWILVGEHNDFRIESSGRVLWQTDDLLIVQEDDCVRVCELYGPPEVSLFAGSEVRRHRVYSLVDPKLGTLVHGGFVERLTEVLQTRKQSYDDLEPLLALKILGLQPRDAEARAERALSRLGGYNVLPKAGQSAQYFLSHLTKDIEHISSLGVSPNPTECQRLANLVLALRNPDGGWTREIQLVHDKNGEIEDRPGWRFRVVPRSDSNTTSTFLALRTLECLRGHLEDKNRAVRFIRGLQNTDGGFKSCSSGAGKSFMSCTFEAVEALHLLGEGPQNPQRCVQWLVAHQRSDGGFADDPWEMEWSALIRGGKKETVRSRTSLRQTYYANKALSTLNSAPNDVRSCADYVMNQRSRFGFGDGASLDAFYALSILGLLEAVNEVNRLE
jgi:hypothetical protein